MDGAYEGGAGEVVHGAVDGGAGGDAGVVLELDPHGSIQGHVGRDVDMGTEGDVAGEDAEVVDTDVVAYGDMGGAVDGAFAADEYVAAVVTESELTEFFGV